MGYTDVAAGTPVNQVEYVYNGRGKVDSDTRNPTGRLRPPCWKNIEQDGDKTVYSTNETGPRREVTCELEISCVSANPNGGGTNSVQYLYSSDPSDYAIDSMMSRVQTISTR